MNQEFNYSKSYTKVHKTTTRKATTTFLLSNSQISISTYGYMYKNHISKNSGSFQSPGESRLQLFKTPHQGPHDNNRNSKNYIPPFNENCQISISTENGFPLWTKWVHNGNSTELSGRMEWQLLEEREHTRVRSARPFGGVHEVRPREGAIHRGMLRIHQLRCRLQDFSRRRRQEVGHGQPRFCGGRNCPMLDAPVLTIAQHLCIPTNQPPHSFISFSAFVILLLESPQ